MKSVMITVRVNSTSSGSGYPRKVYNARHERMGDVMGLNGARVEPKTLRKHNRRKEGEKQKQLKWEGEGEKGMERRTRFSIQVLWKRENTETPPKNAASVVRLGSVGEGIKLVRMLLTWKLGGLTCGVKRLTGLF